MPRRKNPSDGVLLELRKFGLNYPGAHTKSPWPGPLDLAVNDKTFAYLSIEGDPFSISCKLPQSAEIALHLPFAAPTGYGLGKSGWVTARFEAGEVPPLDMFKAWIDESYRAQAPKRLSKGLNAPGAAATGVNAAKRSAVAGRARKAKSVPRKKAARKKTKRRATARA
jgi:predicted DNA-binding protein (MmcQ/YjbR family)